MRYYSSHETLLKSSHYFSLKRKSAPTETEEEKKGSELVAKKSKSSMNAEYQQLEEAHDACLEALHKLDLSSVPTATLVAAVSGLEEVGLPNTELTREQITGILLEDLKLKSLDLGDNDLSAVPTETLVAGISGVEEVDLSRTQLTSEQLTAHKKQKMIVSFNFKDCFVD